MKLSVICSGWVRGGDFWLGRLQMPTSQSRSDPDETSGQKLRVCRKCGWLVLVTYHLFFFADQKILQKSVRKAGFFATHHTSSAHGCLPKRLFIGSSAICRYGRKWGKKGFCIFLADMYPCYGKQCESGCRLFTCPGLPVFLAHIIKMTWQSSL
jgi:hypothetical protein